VAPDTVAPNRSVAVVLSLAAPRVVVNLARPGPQPKGELGDKGR